MERGNSVSTTSRFLENVKENLKRTYIEYIDSFNQSESFKFTQYITDKEFIEARKIIKKLAFERNEEMPKEFIQARTVEEFINDLTFNNHAENYQILSYLTSIFNKYCDFLEDNMFEVEIIKLHCVFPDKLNYHNILEDLENCEKKLSDGDYRGAITSSRSTVEGVIKEILLLFGEGVQESNDTVPKLFRQLSRKMNLDAGNPKLDKPLKVIISGLNGIINGLSELRGVAGDSHANINTPSYHHALLAVNSAKTVGSFLFQTYEYQKKKSELISSVR